MITEYGQFWEGFEKRAIAITKMMPSIKRFMPQVAKTTLPSTAKQIRPITAGPTLNYSRMQSAEDVARKAKLNPAQPAVIDYKNPRNPTYTAAVQTPPPVSPKG